MENEVVNCANCGKPLYLADGVSEWRHIAGLVRECQNLPPRIATRATPAPVVEEAPKGLREWATECLNAASSISTNKTDFDSTMRREYEVRAQCWQSLIDEIDQDAEIERLRKQTCNCACHDDPKHSTVQDWAEANRYHVAKLKDATAEVESLRSELSQTWEQAAKICDERQRENASSPDGLTNIVREDEAATLAILIRSHASQPESKPTS